VDEVLVALSEEVFDDSSLLDPAGMLDVLPPLDESEVPEDPLLTGVGAT
jgi:hypothetical protein